MKDTGFSGYIVEVCTYEYIGDFHGIGRYFEPHFDWVHVGFGNLGLARLEQTLINNRIELINEKNEFYSNRIIYKEILGI